MSKDTIRIEKITEADFKGLLGLFKEFALFQKQPEKMVNTVDKMIKEKDFITGFTAKDEKGTILGYATFFFAYYTWSGKSLYMDDLYIRNQYRGDGIGTLLMLKVIEFARERECHKVRWQISDWNDPAVTFYKALGGVIDDSQVSCDLALNR